MHKKNIVIDRGNSAIKAGVFKGTQLINLREFQKAKELMEWIAEEKPQFAILSSVVRKNKKLIKKLGTYTEVLRLTHLTPLPFTNQYETPETLGADRIAAITGAFHMFKEQNCLVIDAGTTVTYDFIDAGGNYLGGAISPGLQMRARALHDFTSKLPLIKANLNSEIIGKSTQACIESGVANGLLMEMNGMIEYYKRTFGEINVIVCGGDSKFFESKLKGHIFAVANLVLQGLNRILLYNIDSFEDNN